MRSVALLPLSACTWMPPALGKAVAGFNPAGTRSTNRKFDTPVGAWMMSKPLVLVNGAGKTGDAVGESRRTSTCPVTGPGVR
jgi:hypothetical protein